MGFKYPLNYIILFLKDLTSW